MEILRDLASRTPSGAALQRNVLLGPETGARHLSAVLVRLPPGLAAIYLAPGESLRARAAAPGTRLIAVEARAA